MTRFKRTKCNCEECPLRDRKRVYGLAEAEKFSVAIIGEAPGAEEDARGEPFVGASGAKLKEAVALSGMLWHLVYRTNVLLCRPTDNDIDGAEGQEALECCKPGFEEEIEWLERIKLRLLCRLEM
ncbi:MAG: hypothetical protein HC888_02645 [Candidatus Competibacteraceae bacterium]|nr:hypothetical protein [Candidatus Competibacteraceae bacterium]